MRALNLIGRALISLFSNLFYLAWHILVILSFNFFIAFLYEFFITFAMGRRYSLGYYEAFMLTLPWVVLIWVGGMIILFLRGAWRPAFLKKKPANTPR